MQDFKQHTVCGTRPALAAATHLIASSASFHIDPLPDDLYRFTVKPEALKRLEQAVPPAPAPDSAACPDCGGDLHQCRTGEPGCLHCDDCSFVRAPNGHESRNGD